MTSSTTGADRPRPRRAGRFALALAALVLAGCSRGEGPAGLTSAEAIAEAFGCTALEQVSTLPHTPDEYSCTSAGQPVTIYRVDPESADRVKAYVRESTDLRVGQVNDEWYVACSDAPTCEAIEADLDVTFG